MGKHKKQHGGHSSSSSSSDSSDEEFKHLPKHERKQMKKMKKQMKKGLIPPGSIPGMHMGGHGMPHQGGAHGAYPTQPHYPAGGSYPAPAGGSYSAPAGGSYPAPGGSYPAGGSYSYPSNMVPPAGMYPGQAPGYPGGQVPGAYPAGGFVAPGGAPPGGYPGGAHPGSTSSGHPDVIVYPGPGGQTVNQPNYPGGQPGGYQGGHPSGQQGYPTAPQPAHVYTGGLPPPGQIGQPVPTYGGQSMPVVPPGGVPGQMGTGHIDSAAAQFQKMGIQGGNLGMPRPTVRPAPNFSAEKDAEIIRNAMKGVGTDEQAIVSLISQRSNQQRQDIMKLFKTMYGKDLIKDLESELSGDFRETIMALFKPTTYYDAWSLNQAISGLGTKDAVLIEILGTRTNAEIREINAAYKEHFHRTLEKDIMDDTSGHFKRLLVSCCQAGRAEVTPEQWQRLQYEGPEAVIDRNLAKQDAQKLFEAGEKKIGTDESTFLSILAIRHYFQLRATFEEYVKISGRDILSTIEREMSGDLKDGFIALVMSAKNRPEYFADKLCSAMKGAGTQDSTLIRIIVSRCEIDLQDIKDVYLSKYHKTLATSVSSDTSGDYKRLLLALIGQ